MTRTVDLVYFNAGGGHRAAAQALQAVLQQRLGPALQVRLVNLMAVAENYPQLKADANFARLQAELSDIENKLAASRRFFNNATNEYNTAIQQFPALLFAGMFGFKAEPFFALEPGKKEAVAAPPSVSFQ